MRVLLVLILAVCGVGVYNSRADRAEITIRIAFLASSDDEDYVGAMAFKESVEAAAGERVSVQVFPSGQYCGSERECIEALQGGMLEMHQTTFGGLAALFGPAQALDLPYTFANDAVAECVMDGPLLAAMGQSILDQGLGLPDLRDDRRQDVMRDNGACCQADGAAQILGPASGGQGKGIHCLGHLAGMRQQGCTAVGQVQATRLARSTVRHASRIASEMVSETLSG
jgi:hypothetical protein